MCWSGTTDRWFYIVVWGKQGVLSTGGCGSDIDKPKIKATITDQHMCLQGETRKNPYGQKPVFMLECRPNKGNFYNKLTKQWGFSWKTDREPQATFGQLTFHELVTSLTSHQPWSCLALELRFIRHILHLFPMKDPHIHSTERKKSWKWQKYIKPDCIICPDKSKSKASTRE